ncbi:recombinase family protein [Streptomyces luomodiensis]|uniref:Recombinase family protein n=1 Tax=Streptomyces luomodiensis TaxID=3026192 RepID=A0ABY9V6N3_9ACTN|nr:recombinase family protein [Streptomyces sp. SCA4-21]WNE99675.1 recombinase family protein [Streptomyces sp. SCA4-21]
MTALRGSRRCRYRSAAARVGRDSRARPSRRRRPPRRPNRSGGYARCSTAQQELQSQLDVLEPVCKRNFSEKISTRLKTWPELEKALKLAYDLQEAARPGSHPHHPRAQAPRPPN